MFRRKIIQFVSEFDQYLASLKLKKSASQLAEKAKHDVVFRERDVKHNDD